MKLSSLRLGKLSWLVNEPRFRARPVRTLARVAMWEMHRARGATLDLPFDGSTIRVHCTDGVGRLLYYFGTIDPEVFAFLDGYLQPGHVVVDVGANVGTYASFAARRVAPVGEVVAFEPNPEVFARLEANAAGPTTRLEPMAVGAAAGTVDLVLAEDTSKAAVAAGEPADRPTAQVPCVTLDEYLAGRPVDYLKVDCEGFDYDVLVGAAGSFATGAVAAAQVECTERREEIHAFLTGHGYRVARLVPGTGMVEAPAEDLPLNAFAFRPDLAGDWIQGSS